MRRILEILAQPFLQGAFVPDHLPRMSESPELCCCAGNAAKKSQGIITVRNNFEMEFVFAWECISAPDHSSAGKRQFTAYETYFTFSGITKQKVSLCS